MELKVLNKPPFRAPCNGCGECCRLQVCSLGELLMQLPNDAGPCPALELHDGAFKCGMALRPHYYLGTESWGNETLRPMLEFALGFGQGCGMEDESNLGAQEESANSRQD